MRLYILIPCLGCLAAIAFADSPAFQSQESENPSHKQADKAQGDRVNEHSIHTIIDHPIHGVGRLGRELVIVCTKREEDDDEDATYTRHEHYAARDETERGEQLSRRARWDA